MKTLAEVEKDYILSALEHHKGNRTHTAVTLGVGLRTLQRKLEEYGLPKGKVPDRCKKVRCLETGEVFQSQQDAGFTHRLTSSEVSWSVKIGKPVKGLTFERVV